MIDFGRITEAEHTIIRKIAQRAAPFFRAARVRQTEMDTIMDVEAAHLACPLDLACLLVADDFDFMHDVAGIRNHLNRQTGELEGCFLPRFALPEPPSFARERVRSIGVDYNPDAILSEALEAAGLPAFNALPWKTLMVFGNGGVRVKQGYGAPFVDVPLEAESHA